MKTALLFSGLGDPTTHTVVQQEMAQDSSLIEQALCASDCTVDSLFCDGGRMLPVSHVIQPLHIALALTQALRVREKGFEADFFAGHSLGEVAAWAFAGAMSPEDAVEIAAVRGQSMGAAARIYEGDMLALTDIDADGVQQMLTIGQAHGPLTVGAYNAPQEVVLTGTLPALQAVAPLCQSRRLNVGGPWHSPLMEEAKPDLAAALGRLCIRPQIRPVVSGINGNCINDTKDIVSQFLALLIEPLRWTTVLATLASLGVGRFVIAGPGRVLRYLVRRNLPEAKVELI
jgi:[acyl-carrier-protein] S-malonyltransferase